VPKSQETTGTRSTHSLTSSTRCADSQSTDPDPNFTMYVIRRSSDGRAVGGFGFSGPPDEEGRFEFGYGLIPSARNQGLATGAVQLALSFAARHGAKIAVAGTEASSLPSQRVPANAGLLETGRDGSLILYSRTLSAHG